MPSLQYAFASDTGRVRQHNEDAVSVCPGIGLAMVADGMGGYNAGEVASGIATSVLREALEQRFLRDPSLMALPAPRLQIVLSEEVQHANASIYAAARAEPAYQGMGTTLVAALLRESDVLVAHIGDSRAYRLRAGRLEMLTRDHSLLQEQVDAGLMTVAQARAVRHKNLLTRGMGIEPQVQVDIAAHSLLPGDVLLLCSDGLTDELEDPAIESILMSSSSLEEASRKLVECANAHGGVDNISVVLVRQEAPQKSVGARWPGLRRLLPISGFRRAS